MISRRSVLAFFGLAPVAAVTSPEPLRAWGFRRAGERMVMVAGEAGSFPMDTRFSALLDAHGPIGSLADTSATLADLAGTNAPLGLPPATRIGGAGKQGSAACAAQDQGEHASAHVEQAGATPGAGEGVSPPIDPAPASDASHDPELIDAALALDPGLYLPLLRASVRQDPACRNPVEGR